MITASGPRMNVRSYRDLSVWQKSMQLALNVYGLTRNLPTTEKYGLSSQLQRAAVSIPANIAEGHAVGLPKPFIRHLRIALGSLAELETELLLARKLGYGEVVDISSLLEQSAEIQRMLFALRRTLERKLP